MSALLSALTPASKPWLDVLLQKGSTWTVPATASLVTVSGVAAGGMSDGAAYSAPATTATNVSAEMLTDDLIYVASITPACTTVVQSELSSVRQSPTLTTGYPWNYGCVAKAYYLGQWWTITAGSYNSNSIAGIASSTDLFATAYYAGAIVGNKAADLITDPSGSSPMVAYVENSTSNYCYLYSDPTFTTLLTGGAQSATFSVITGGRFVNGYFVAFGTDASGSTHPQLLYSNATTVWTAVKPSASDGCTLSDIAYSPTLGLFVAVGSVGKIYTAATLGGAWTSQTSGTSNALTGVIWANGTFVVVGASGTILTSANGTAWTTATGTGTVGFNRRAVMWNAFLNVFAAADGNTGIFYTSPTGAVWTQVATIGSSVTQLLFTQCGKQGKGTYWKVGVSATPVYSVNGGVTWITLSSVTPGRSDMVLAKNGVEVLRLRGGGTGTSTAGGNGGSYRTPEVTGPTVAGAPGNGAGGVGGYPGTADSGYQVIPIGNGGKATFNATATIPAGGGGGVFVYPEFPATAAGLFVGGASGAMINSAGATADWPGGGGSLFALGGSASVNASADASRAPGRGAQGCRVGTTNYGAGGGGEGCVRVPIACQPGDVFEAWGGLGAVTTVNANAGPYAGDGFLLIEYQN